MKNLIITICLSVVVSLSFAQIDVVGPQGNVGMGIANPAAKLHVKGTVRYDNTGASASTIFNRTDGSAFIIGSGYANSGFTFASGRDFRIAANDRQPILDGAVSGAGASLIMNITGDGKVGIGTYTPEAKLHVNGWIARTGSYAPSDKRLKSDVNNFNYGLNEVLKLNPVNFTYNGKGGTKKGAQHAGLIAQNLEEVAPELVKDFVHKDIEMSDEGEDIVKSEETYLAIKDSEIKFMLINAIKEQQEMIENQNEKIKSLQSTVSDLKQQVNEKGNSSTLIIDDVNVGKLSQNTPNPLKEETLIKYFIPENTNSASLRVQDLNGKLIKDLPINNTGRGELNLKINNLASGLYTYSLVIDGNVTETMKMIVE